MKVKLKDPKKLDKHWGDIDAFDVSRKASKNGEYLVFAIVYAEGDLHLMTEVYHGITIRLGTDDVTIIDDAIPKEWVVMNHWKRDIGNGMESEKGVLVCGYPELKDHRLLFSDFVDSIGLPEELWKYKIQIEREERKAQELQDELDGKF